ncbi:MAG TPA: vitamin B12-dependent ribonucleotide reductase [Terriglobales bacterium]|nr:vitamin B12-dependent ribonucleotide reductase [Terriglobales bacterium]
MATDASPKITTAATRGVPQTHGVPHPSPAGEGAISKKRAPGLTFKRFYTEAGKDPYATVEWETRTAQITDTKGNVIFEQPDVDVPKDWSITATNIVAQKYLHGTLGTPDRETGVRQLVSRVAETIRDWGLAGGYFHSFEDAEIFHDELVYILLHQIASFNSPVWFNVGCDRIEPSSDAQNWHYNPQLGRIEFGVTGYKNPQCSACFINSIKDSLDSILTLAKTEGMLFKWGSGTGTNLSPLRSSMECLSGGGTASGPLSFMKGFDAFAGVIKSGGKTRRAAKMVILNIDHPDIVDYIECKAKEEAKAWALVQAGYDGSSPDSEAYSSIFFQNANNSVRVTDDFMYAVERDSEFSTLSVKEPRRVVKTYRARDLLRRVAEATWQCGDPGMQFDTTINKWHTSKNSARINASNPCSEYMFLDDSACNLASLNLLKFAPNGTFDADAYRFAVDVMITAQEILVDNSGYPTEAIAKNSHDYRPLGLGYANLGALLMASGLPYDSDAGRAYAACVTAIMCGEAYLQSSRIAELCPGIVPITERTADAEITGGACPGWYINREPFLDVIRMHRAEVNNIQTDSSASSASSAVQQLPALKAASAATWDAALAHGEKHGYRNSQVTVLAPTGTIGFMMDCDTTGIEPDLGLVKYKKLVGGGMIKIVNTTVPAALFKLGYTSDQANAIVSFIDATGTIEGAPHIQDEHLAVFDCSFRPSKGTRSIHYMGHIKMMAAVQPFLSGAISKTVNLSENATIDDIMEAYIQAWRLGLKAVAIYRDGCKKSQPLVLSQEVKEKAEALAKVRSAGVSPAVAAASSPAPEEEDLNAPPRAVRHKLAPERMSVTHKFNIGGHEGYITVGTYPNGQPGEIFITMAKEGSTVSGLMDSFALATSIALQHGVPLKLLCEKFEHTRFEPSGWSHNPDIGFAKSIMDYIFRWLHLRFLTGQQQSLFDNFRPKSPVAVTSAENGTTLTPTDKAPEQPSLLTTNDQRPTTSHVADAMSDLIDLGDAPSCSFCGSIMVRNGSCYKCMSCGSTSGCS